MTVGMMSAGRKYQSGREPPVDLAYQHNGGNDAFQPTFEAMPCKPIMMQI